MAGHNHTTSQMLRLISETSPTCTYKYLPPALSDKHFTYMY